MDYIWVGLELIRQAHLSVQPYNIHFWRDPNGPEVDWVINRDGVYTPIEAKWTTAPQQSDIKHLHLFKAEYENTGNAYVVCQVQQKTKLAEGIYAIPWYELGHVFNDHQ